MLLIIYGMETVWLTQISVNKSLFRSFLVGTPIFSVEQQGSLQTETQKKTDIVYII